MDFTYIISREHTPGSGETGAVVYCGAQYYAIATQLARVIAGSLWSGYRVYVYHSADMDTPLCSFLR